MTASIDREQVSSNWKLPTGISISDAPTLQRTSNCQSFGLISACVNLFRIASAQSGNNVCAISCATEKLIRAAERLGLNSILNFPPPAGSVLASITSCRGSTATFKNSANAKGSYGGPDHPDWIALKTVSLALAEIALMGSIPIKAAKERTEGCVQTACFSSAEDRVPALDILDSHSSRCRCVRSLKLLISALS